MLAALLALAGELLLGLILGLVVLLSIGFVVSQTEEDIRRDLERQGLIESNEDGG